MAFFQFSLQRLLVGVTVVCVICAIAVAFPNQFLAVGLTIGMFVPALVVALVFTALSAKRVWTFNVSMLGALVGYVLSPVMTGFYSNWVHRLVSNFEL